MKATNNIELKLKKYLQKYIPIKKELIEETSMLYEEEISNTSFIELQHCGTAMKTPSINNYINKEFDNNNFQTKLFNLIDTSGKTDSEIYNKAYIDRRLFSKIRNDIHYHPSKNTVISLGLALNLNITEFEELLSSASYSLPKNNTFDLIIRF